MGLELCYFCEDFQGYKLLHLSPPPLQPLPLPQFPLLSSLTLLC